MRGEGEDCGVLKGEEGIEYDNRRRRCVASPLQIGRRPTLASSGSRSIHNHCILLVFPPSTDFICSYTSAPQLIPIPSLIPSTIMSLRMRSLRSLRPISLPLRPIILRSYATPSQPPRPSKNSPAPAGIEGLFGSDRKGGTTSAPSPPNVEPQGPSEPKVPDVDLPGLGEGAKEEKGERPKLGGLAGKKVGTGGGGGGGSGGGAGGPGGMGGMTPNQLLLAVVRYVYLISNARL